MELTLIFPILLIGVLVIPGLMIWALVDLMSRPSSDWEQADQQQLIWALLVVFVGVIGPILYLTIGRSKLNSPTAVQQPLANN